MPVYVVFLDTCLFSGVPSAGTLYPQLLRLSLELMKCCSTWSRVVVPEVSVSIDADIFALCVNLHILFVCLDTLWIIFSPSIVVLWWAVGIQMWNSQIWFLTRSWGGRSRARRQAATGRSTFLLIWHSSLYLCHCIIRFIRKEYVVEYFTQFWPADACEKCTFRCYTCQQV